MRNLKKLCAVILTVALTVTAMVPAFAATTVTPASVSAGIEDASVKTAVERLVSFGIVQGTEDGKYHPEQNMTRDAFAKVVVEALGMGSAAIQGPTKFSDVPADKWSSGYVNVAVGAGIIKGRADGTFGAADNVTYAEAVTMLVRALGYKDDFLSGNWPGNYLAKAAELNITSGLKISPSGVADRGAVAVMLNNALDAKVLTQESYGTENKWTPGKKTLYEDKLNIIKVDSVRITDVATVNDGLKANEVKIIYDDEVTGKNDVNKTLKAVDSVNISGLLGLEADLFIKDDGADGKINENNDKILYVEVTTSSSDIIYGEVKETKAADRTIKIKLADGSDDDYDVVKLNSDKNNTTLYVDNEKQAQSNWDKDIFENGAGKFGTFIKNSDGDIAFAVLYEKVDEAVVKEISKDKKYVKGLKESNVDHKVDFSTDDGYKLFMNGKVVTLDDVKAGDVIRKATVKDHGDDYNYGFITRNAVTGKLGKVKADNIVVGTKDYDVAKSATYSLDKDANIDPYPTDLSKLDDAIGGEVTAYLDLKGEVVHITTSAKATSDDLYGVVQRSFTTDDQVKIYTKDDTDVTYTLDEDTTNVNKGDVVQYSLSKDSKIDYDKKYADSDYQRVAYHNGTAVVVDTAKIAEDSTLKDVVKAVSVKSFDDEKDYIETDLGKFYVDSATQLMSYYDGSKTDPASIDPEVVKWADIKSKDTDAGLKAILVLDDNQVDIKYVLFTENYTLTGDTHSAYVKGDKYYDKDWKVDVRMSDGKDKAYILSSKDIDVNEGDFIVFETNKDGEISNTVVRSVYDDAYAVVGHGLNANKDGYLHYDMDDKFIFETGKVTKFSNGVIKLENGHTYKVLSATQIYKLKLKDTKKYDDVTVTDSGDIDEGSIVRVVQNDGDLEMVVIMQYTK